MKKILFVFGTRPEAIKMAPLIKEFQKYSTIFKTIVCVSGQHREMLDQVLDLFEIKPDYDLNIMKQGQDLYDITARVLVGMRDILAITEPDYVLVHGDTTTSTAAALAAFYKQIPVGHIEAGLRTNNIYSPWPEEINRQITTRISSLHFAPTELSKINLQKEGVAEDKIYVTGNTVIDALYLVIKKMDSNLNLLKHVDDLIINSGYDLSRLHNNKRRLILITGHRRENFGDGFLNICNSIKQLSILYPDVDFVYPMHLNPNVRNPINKVFGSEKLSNVFFIEPQEYLQFVRLMNLATIILTDSGGVQEEAPGLGKPVLVMRDTTERPEAVSAGTVKLVGTNIDSIINEVELLLDNKEVYNNMKNAKNPYGNGESCSMILNTFLLLCGE